MSTGHPIEHGTTIKYPSVALLCVDSANGEIYDKSNGFRVGNNNPSRIYINKQRPLLFGYMTRLALTEVNVQWSTPNVNSYNNTLTIGVWNNAEPPVLQGYTRITIPVGFYTAPLLGRRIAQALNGNATLTATLGANTFNVIIGGLLVSGPYVPFAGTTQTATDSNFTITTSSTTGSFAIMPYNSVITGLPQLQDDLTNMIGLTPTKLPGVPFYREITGGYASMLYTPYVDIISSLLTKNQNIQDADSAPETIGGILARVYLTNENITQRVITVTYAPTTGIFNGSTDNSFGCSESSFRREFKFPKQIQWNSTENVDVIDLQVVDYRNNPLFIGDSVSQIGSVVNINNTADFQFTLMATEV